MSALTRLTDIWKTLLEFTEVVSRVGVHVDWTLGLVHRLHQLGEHILSLVNIHRSYKLLHLFRSLNNYIKAAPVVFAKIYRPGEVGKPLNMFLDL